MNAERVLVTGSSGFIGRHLVENLAEHGQTIIGVDREPPASQAASEHVTQDLQDRESTADLFCEMQPDVVYHLAAPVASVAESLRHPERTIEQNVAVDESVLQAVKAIDRPVRLIKFSSVEAIGGFPLGHVPVNERMSYYEPNNPYGSSKQLAEMRYRSYAHDVPIIILRPFNVIGSGQRLDFVMPSLAAQLVEVVEGARPEIEVGNLEVKRDFVNVRDCAEAARIIGTLGTTGDVYHVGSGKSYSVETALTVMIELSGVKDLKVVQTDARKRPNDPPIQVADTTKLQALGWSPKRPLRETLNEIMEEAAKAG